MKIPPWVLLPFVFLLVVLDFLSALKRDAEPPPPAETAGPTQAEVAPARRSDLPPRPKVRPESNQ